MGLQVQASSSNFDRLAEEIWSMMNQVSCGNYFRSRRSSAWAPAINVYEADHHFILCAEIAGMTREGIQVTLEGRDLVISGDRPKPSLPGSTERLSVLLMEMDSGRFRRAVTVPADVDIEKVTAQYRDGLLFVMLPRIGPNYISGGGA